MQNALNSNFLFNLFFDDLKLSPTEFTLYYLIRQIYFFWGDTEGCYVSNEFISEKINVSVSTVKRTLERLKELKLITTDTVKLKDGFNRRYIYPLEDNVLILTAEQVRTERDNLRAKVQTKVQNEPRAKGQNEPIDNIHILNNFKDIRKEYKEKNKLELRRDRQAISCESDFNSEVEIESESDVSDSSDSTGISDLTSLLANSEAQQILEGSIPLRSEQQAARPPLPLAGDFSSKCPGNPARKKSNGGEPIPTLGLEEKNGLSERKHGEFELTTNPSNDTIKTTWNRIAEEYGLPQVSAMTESRSRKAKAAIKACGGIDKWSEGIRSQLEKSAFHRGENDRGWRANFDYYSRSEKALAALETIGTRSPAKKSSFEEALEILYGDETWKQ